MFGFGGLSEVMFILFLAMLIFGPEKLPEMGRKLAKIMGEVRKASNELKRTFNAELAISEQEAEARRNQQANPAPPLPPPAAAWWSGEPVAADPPGYARPIEAPTPSPAGAASALAAEPATVAREAAAAVLTAIPASPPPAPADGAPATPVPASPDGYGGEAGPHPS